MEPNNSNQSTLKLQLLNTNAINPFYKDVNTGTIYHIDVNNGNFNIHDYEGNTIECVVKNLRTIQTSKTTDTNVGMFGEVGWKLNVINNLNSKIKEVFLPLNFHTSSKLFLKKIGSGDVASVSLKNNKQFIDIIQDKDADFKTKAKKIAQIFIDEFIKVSNNCIKTEMIALQAYKNAGLAVPNMYPYSMKHSIERHTDSEGELAKPMKNFLDDIQEIIRISHDSMSNDKLLSDFGQSCYIAINERLQEVEIPTLVSEFIENASTLKEKKTDLKKLLKEALKEENEKVITQIATIFAAAMTLNDDDIMANTGNVMLSLNNGEMQLHLIDFGRALDTLGENEKAYEPFQKIIDIVSQNDNTEKLKELFWSTVYETHIKTVFFIAKTLNKNHLKEIDSASFVKLSKMGFHEREKLPQDVFENIEKYYHNSLTKTYIAPKIKKTTTESNNENENIKQAYLYNSMRIENEKQGNNFNIQLPENMDIYNLAAELFNSQITNIKQKQPPFTNQAIIRKISEKVSQTIPNYATYLNNKDYESLSTSFHIKHSIPQTQFESIHINKLNSTKIPSKNSNPLENDLILDIGKSTNIRHKPDLTLKLQNDKKEEETKCIIF
jgi:hypothetical protein